MDDILLGEARLRITRWIEEGTSVLGVLPGMFEEHERLRAALEATEHESARLRQELLLAQGENDALRREREEIAEVIAESVNPIMNEALQRLRAPVMPRDPVGAEPTYS